LQPTLSDYDSSNDFIKQFHVTDAMFDDFIIYASSTIKEMDSNEIMTSKNPIKTLLKAYAARFKWGDEAYYQTVNNTDEGFKKAIAAIQ
jgi:carboxyl-terminal processing protease